MQTVEEYKNKYVLLASITDSVARSSTKNISQHQIFIGELAKPGITH